MKQIIPYPLRATKLDISICPFTFWWKPTFTKRKLDEKWRKAGTTLWWARWLWFQISYGRLI